MLASAAASFSMQVALGSLTAKKTWVGATYERATPHDLAVPDLNVTSVE
jgi:hypothetical protein